MRLFLCSRDLPATQSAAVSTTLISAKVIRGESRTPHDDHDGREDITGPLAERIDGRLALCWPHETWAGTAPAGRCSVSNSRRCSPGLFRRDIARIGATAMTVVDQRDERQNEQRAAHAGSDQPGGGKQPGRPVSPATPGRPDPWNNETCCRRAVGSAIVGVGSHQQYIRKLPVEFHDIRIMRTKITWCGPA